MLDINVTLDLVKLKFFNEWLYTSHLYDEGPSPIHEKITNEVLKTYIDPLKLKKDAVVLDIGCGYGYFLKEMKKKGYTKVTGTTLSEANAKELIEQGYDVKNYDPTFIPQKDGWNDESVDFIFLRHTLHHSPYPVFSLIEYNRLLKQNGKMFIEVPAPDCDRQHEYNQSIYSIMGKNQLNALLMRTGFKIDVFNEIDFELSTKEAEDGEEKIVNEKYFCIMVTKNNPLDIK